MKFLDEEITLDYTGLPNTSYGQSYSYIVKMGVSPHRSTIFAGSAFKGRFDTSLHVDIAEIARSYAFDNDAIEKPLKNYNKPVYNGIVDTIDSYITVENSSYDSQVQDVAFLYHYPRHIAGFSDTSILPGDTSNRTNYLNNLLQGQVSCEQAVLVPRIPFVSTSEYGFGAVYQTFGFSSPKIAFQGNLDGEILLNNADNTNIYYAPLSVLYGASWDLPDYECIDAEYLIAGQVVTGNAQWNDAHAGIIKNSASTNMTISFCTSTGTTLAHGILFSTLEYEKLTTVTFTSPGMSGFGLIRIGNGTDALDIPVDSTYAKWFTSPSRTFTVQVDIVRHQTEPDTFEIVKINVFNDVVRTSPETGIITIGGHVLAKMEYCPADWYLEWIDNYGSFQSQPFHGKTVFSETLTYLKTENYAGRQRKSYFGQEGKFQINSGWVSSRVYPVYQSIFTSPRLLLYDVANDRSYNVLLTDTGYEEKRYIRQKEVINLTLNLALDRRVDKIN